MHKWTRIQISLTVLLATSCASAPTATRDQARLSRSIQGRAQPSVPSRRLDSDANGFYQQPAGVADDYPENSFTPEKIIADLEAAHAVGAHYFRVGMSWAEIEKKPGEYSWQIWDRLIDTAEQYGVTILPYVCYTPKWLNSDPVDFWRKPPDDFGKFAQFMETIAARYRGRVPSWELWNEPDNEYYWLGTVKQFAAMIRQAIPRVRKADPEAKIVLGGMSKGRGPFLDYLMKDDHLGDVVDVINLHGYFDTWSAQKPEDYPAFVHSVKELMDSTSPGKDLWFAEFGYSDYRLNKNHASEWSGEILFKYEHTPQYQAVSLWKDHIEVLATGDLSLTTWYRIDDLPEKQDVIGDNNNKHLGLLSLSGKPKPAFHALKLYNRLFDSAVRSADQQIVLHYGDKRRQEVVHAFKTQDGRFLVTGWLKSPAPSEVKDHSGMARDKRKEHLSIEIRDPDLNTPKVFLYKLDGTSKEDDQALNHVVLKGDQAFIAEVRP
jgi:hypothetical protein